MKTSYYELSQKSKIENCEKLKRSKMKNLNCYDELAKKNEETKHDIA